MMTKLLAHTQKLSRHDFVVGPKVALFLATLAISFHFNEFTSRMKKWLSKKYKLLYK